MSRWTVSSALKASARVSLTVKKSNGAWHCKCALERIATMIATAVIACVIAALANFTAYVCNENSLVYENQVAPRMLFCSNR